MQKRNKKNKIEMPLGITIDSHGKKIDWAMVKIVTDNNEVIYSELVNKKKGVNMGQKLLWSGLTLIMASSLLSFIPVVTVVGQLLMVVGLVLYLLDK